MSMIRETGISLVCITLLAVITSCVYFSHFKDFYSSDSPTYITPAANLLAGHGFTDVNGNPETNRTPAYSLLIVPFLWAHMDLHWLVLLQHLMRTVLILGTFVFAFWLTGSQRQAVLSGILLCIDLPFLAAANYVLTEILFTAVLSVMLILLWVGLDESRNFVLRLIVIGLMGGALVMIRPIALYFWLPVSAYLFLFRKHKRIQAIAIFMIGFICIPLLWGIRNYHQTGYFTVSSISGYSVLQYRAAGVLAINDPGDFQANAERRKTELTAQACHDAPPLAGKDCANMSVAEQSKYFTKYGSRIVLQHPFAYLKLTAHGTAMTMLGGGAGALSEVTGMNLYSAAKLLLIYTVPVFCLAIWGLKAFYCVEQKFFWLSLLVCVYFVGISAGAESYARFRIPIMPIYSILVAAGIDAAIRILGNQNRQKS
jgi:hypothetical protein